MRVILLILATLALAVPAGAEECVPTTSTPQFDSCMTGVSIGVMGECEYLINDLCQLESGNDRCLFSVWHYFEANDIPGLQRGDEVHDDTCGGKIRSDHIIS